MSTPKPANSDLWAHREIASDIVLRPIGGGDGPALAAAHRKNRAHLAPWDPLRSESFFRDDAQSVAALNLHAACRDGQMLPLVLCAGDRIIGRATLSGISGGPFCSANLGYWVDAEFTGRGLARAAIARTAEIARNSLGLHRLQAAALPHNAASRAVLRASGFHEIGLAPAYLQIAGTWQDHVLSQLILHDSEWPAAAKPIPG